MKVSTVLAGLLAGVAMAAPADLAAMEERAATCTNPIQRKEWRKLNVLEQSNFLFSVKCLMSLPSKMKSKYPASTSRYEDFISIHQENTPFVHYNGAFFPWHRAFLNDFETALRNECLYFGGLPYWETALDYADVPASPVMSGILGFGGNGVGDVVVPDGGPSNKGNCIGNGIFKNEVIHIAQGAPPQQSAERCILRYLRPALSTYWWDPRHVVDALAQGSYETFATTLEGITNPTNPFLTLGIHNGGHGSIGGDMSDMFTSNTDPLFYVFHANLDRIWAKWQAANPTARQYDVSNPIAPRGPIQMWPNPPAGNVTLDYELRSLNLKVGQIMNTKGKGMPYATGKSAGTLCFEYV